MCGEGRGLDHKGGRQDLYVLILPSAIIHSVSMDFFTWSISFHIHKTEMETRSLTGIFYTLQMEFVSSEFTSTCLFPPALYLFLSLWFQIDSHKSCSRPKLNDCLEVKSHLWHALWPGSLPFHRLKLATSQGLREVLQKDCQAPGI